VVASFGLTLLAIFLFAIFSARYESHFKVLLRRGRTDPMVSSQSATSMDFTRPDITEEELNSEVELLRDEGLLKLVVLGAGLVDAGTTKSELPAETERAVRKLSRRLTVEALKKSNLIAVTYKDTEPARAQRVLAELSKFYVGKHLNLERPQGQLKFFEDQAGKSQKRLHESEKQLDIFIRARGVTDAALERDIAVQKLGEADAGNRLIEQQRVEAQQRIASLREQIKLFPSRSVTVKRWADNPEVLEKMKTHLLELQLKRTELLTRYEPSYRMVQEVERQIGETRGSIAAEALTPVRDETTDKDPNYEWARLEMEKNQVQDEALRARYLNASAQTSALRMFAVHLQSESIEQQDLTRTVKADEDSYLLYLRKREEARIGDALDELKILNVAIVEPPMVPALPAHSTFLYLSLGLALALVCSIAVAFTSEYFDPTIRTPDEALQVLDVPVLAWLPASRPTLLASSGTRFSRPKVVIE
jgi:uncharacterized protein involved in exopolysaccharide biosynthesis